MTRLVRTHLLVAAALTLAGPTAFAQNAPERPMLGSTFTAPVLADLPTGTNLYSVFDAIPAEVISDRVDTGGLYSGQAARVGSHGSSWTQTLFRLGEVDITNPDGTGTPMLVPGVYVWDRVDVTTGLMPIEMNAPGMAVTLVPRRPSSIWTRQVEFVGAGTALLARQAPTNPPGLATQHSLADGHVLLSGPIIPGRLGIVFAGGATTSTRFERADPRLIDSTIASAFTHLVFTPNLRNEVRAIGWVEHASYPYANRVAFAQPLAAESVDAEHGQISWEHKTATDGQAALFASFARRAQSHDLQATSALVAERLTAGPIPELLHPANGSALTWSVGTRFKMGSLSATSTGHVLRGGVSVSGASATSRSSFNGRIGELIAGVPARVWDYTSPTVDSQWGQTSFVAYGADTITLRPGLTLEAGVRFEALRASAEGSASAIVWRNWLPRANLRWEIVDYAKIAAVAGFARYGNRLPLNDLAVGDPAAPFARVYRWDTNAASPRLADLGPLVARVGPGTGGNNQFTAIDPNIVRPYMDEFVAGFESRPRAGTLIRLAALARREKQLLGLVNIGVPESAYIATAITDPGDDHAGKQQLPVYSRPSATFGLDRYLLTNPADNQSTFVGVEFTLQTTLKNAFLMAGATAGRSEAISANIGFTPLENDAGVLGDVFIDPNSRTFAQGRVFSERGYTIKTAGVFTLPWDVKLGYAARYSDGQHFARLVVVQGLNQGPEAVRAFRNGATRFTFTGTLDGRLQKAFAVSGHQLAVFLDAYNVLNLAYEIEEFDVTGPTSRLTSAIQPPRTVHLGVRLTF
ncbi:MAG: TonB-dependent receptor [Acidobacteriota bacterium]